MNTIIRRDTNFLASCQIMDYSILLGIETKVLVDVGNFDHKIRNGGRKNSRASSTAELARFKRHRYLSTDGLHTYHISIIDFL